MGAAGGMAIADLSGTLGYRGLAGVLAVAGVLAAATWVRGLDARAWLPRHARIMFLVPAAAVAAAAVFTPRAPGGALTAVAVILTAGAVLLNTDLLFAALMLASTAMAGLGTAYVCYGIWAVLFLNRDVLGTAGTIEMGVMFTALGAAAVGFGVASMANQNLLLEPLALMRRSGKPLGVGLIAVGIFTVVTGVWLPGVSMLAHTAYAVMGAAGVGLGAARLTDRRMLLGVAVIGFAAAVITVGAVSVASRAMLLGATIIGGGMSVAGIWVAYIGPAVIWSGIHQMLDSVTQAPSQAEDAHGADPDQNA